jgi:hypothetical protein
VNECIVDNHRFAIWSLIIKYSINVDESFANGHCDFVFYCCLAIQEYCRSIDCILLYSTLSKIPPLSPFSIEQSKLCLSITLTSDQGSYNDTTIQWVYYYHPSYFIDDVACSHQATNNSCLIQGANFSTHKAAHHKQSNSLTHIRATTMYQLLLGCFEPVPSNECPVNKAYVDCKFSFLGIICYTGDGECGTDPNLANCNGFATYWRVNCNEIAVHWAGVDDKTEEPSNSPTSYKQADNVVCYRECNTHQLRKRWFSFEHCKYYPGWAILNTWEVIQCTSLQAWTFAVMLIL